MSFGRGPGILEDWKGETDGGRRGGEGSWDGGI